MGLLLQFLAFVDKNEVHQALIDERVSCFCNCCHVLLGHLLSQHSVLEREAELWRENSYLTLSGVQDTELTFGHRFDPSHEPSVS